MGGAWRQGVVQIKFLWLFVRTKLVEHKKLTIVGQSPGEQSPSSKKTLAQDKELRIKGNQRLNKELSLRCFTRYLRKEKSSCVWSIGEEINSILILFPLVVFGNIISLEAIFTLTGRLTTSHFIVGALLPKSYLRPGPANHIKGNGCEFVDKFPTNFTCGII